MSVIDNGALPKTVAWHDSGQYAWQNSAHGERLLSNQRQATDARMKQFDGQGTVRTAAPGTTFTLADHPEHDRDGLEQIGRMSILIDGGGNGYNERLQYAAFIQRYLGDGMETVQTGTITATRQRINHGQWTTTGNAFTLNVNYTPQRPSGVENETTFFSGGAAYPL